MTFGQRLKAERLKRGWTQEQLGAKCKQPLLAAQISQYENDHRKPDAGNLLHIIIALGCHAKDLMPPSKIPDNPPGKGVYVG